MSAYVSTLRRPDVRRLFAGAIISFTGSWAYNVALLAFLYDRTHSLGWVGAAGFVRFVPSLLLSTPGGVLAERTERIRLMIRSDLASAVCQAGLMVIAITAGPPVLALLCAALTSITSVVYPPATAATIPTLVSEEDLAAANALNASIEQLVVIVGPAVGALVLLIASPAAAFGVNVASFLISAVLLSGIRSRTTPVDVTEAGTVGPLRQMLVGAKAIAAQPAARTLVAFCALVSFVYGTDTVLFMGVSVHRLGTGVHGFGYLLGALGVGGVLMAAAVNRLAAAPRLSYIILAGALGYTLPTALLTVIRAPGLAVAVEIFRGSSTLIVDVLAITALQRAIPSDQLARVFGVFFAFVLAAITLGTIITPAVVSAFGLTTAIWVMAVGPAAVALAGYPALIAIDRATAARARLLAPRIAALEAVGLFTGATRPILERLAAEATEVTFEPRTVIVREGDTADAVYVVTDGSVYVTARGERSSFERPIRTLTAPAFFGEIGVLEHIPRTATVTAAAPCRCVRIGADALLQAFTTTPPSSGVMESARTRLALTHPSRALTFKPPAVTTEVA